MKKTIFVFSVLIIALLALFQLSKYAYFFSNTSIEPILAAIAVVFLVLGFFLNHRKPRKEVHQNQEIDHQRIKELGISQREYEVLKEISFGLSNKEIGKKLHVSESTVKTHVSNILIKLDAKRRTQAIKRAKELGIMTI